MTNGKTKSVGTCLIAAAALAASGAAGATTYEANGVAQATMTYTTLAQVATSMTSGYSGVGSIFISTESTAVTGYGRLCTASLVNGRTLVTAAHCLYDYDSGVKDAVTSIKFYLPSYGDKLLGATVTTYVASDWEYNPLYDDAGHEGDILGGHDIAMITLQDLVVGADTYDFYTGNPLQQYTEVGTGTVGGAQGTNIGVTSDYLKRTGSNIFEFYGDDIFSDVSHGIVLADFDDGTRAHDVFGLLGDSQTGVAGEAGSSPGDSGGPNFINGQIAAVTSFGVTGGIFYGYCGGNSVDPYNTSGGTTPTSLSRCTNSSVGEIIGDTLTSYNLDFLYSYMDTHPVPEPATWMQMIAGFALLGGVSRRVRGRTRFAAA